jgi:ABC-2 type transport system ATP-binding protein
VRTLVRSLASQGTTIFVSSHLLAEIEQICTHAAIMSAGALVAQGTLDELREVGRARVRVETADRQIAADVLTRLGMTVQPENAGDSAVEAVFGNKPVEPDVIVAALVKARVRVRGFAVESPSLEDRFVSLTGEGFNVDH